MTTKGRTHVSAYVPDEWVELIDAERGETTRSAFVLELIRAHLGKREHKKPNGRGRPRINEGEVGAR
jgi:hypothetical protein